MGRPGKIIFSAGNYTETEERVNSLEYVFNEYLLVAVAWGSDNQIMALLVVGGKTVMGTGRRVRAVRCCYVTCSPFLPIRSSSFCLSLAFGNRIA